VKDKIEFSGFGDRFRGVPLLGGLFTGVLSFVLGYLSFFGIAAGTGSGIDFNSQSLRQVGLFFYNSFRVQTHEQIVDIREYIVENETSGENQTALQETFIDVWYNPFFNADTVERQRRRILGGNLVEKRSSTFNPDAPGFFPPDLSFPDFVYMAIPVVLLVGLGFLFAYRYISLEDVAEPSDLLDRTLIGALTITVGFLLLALLGTYVFVIEEIALYTQQTSADSFTRPDRIDTLLYATLYPLLCSGAGILLGQLARKPNLDGTTEDSDETDDSDDSDEEQS
jgi:hypothetical protein